MRRLEGRVIAITGAAQGIGRALCLAGAQAGCQLALADIDAAALSASAALARQLGVKVSATELDVRQRSAVFAWAESVARQHSQVHVLVNNAGVNLNAAVEDAEIADLEWVLETNFWGVVHATQAFLPYLRQADWAQIVNLSSVYGLIATPRQAGYHAAKFAVRGFTEALAIELEAERSSVGVSCVHPGGVRTNIVRRGRIAASPEDSAEIIRAFDRIALSSPERVARKILEAVVSNRRRVLIGADAHFFDQVQRLFPTLYQRALARFFRRPRTP